MSFSPLSKNAEQIDEKWTSASCSPTATNDKRLITTVRVVVHNVEHLKNDKFALALNHWSIYLLIPDAQGGSNSAVRINMRHIPGTKEWQLVWTNHAYTHPYSALIWWDWKLTGTGLKLCPKDVEQFLLKKGFDQFEGECDSEQGCRWWVCVSTLLLILYSCSDFLVPSLFSVVPIASKAFTDSFPTSQTPD